MQDFLLVHVSQAACQPCPRELAGIVRAVVGLHPLRHLVDSPEVETQTC